MIIYGYARVSTPTQSLERQIKNILKEYPTAQIIQEKYTGTTSDRPNWSKLKERIYKQISHDEVTIVFDSVSRMSRNAQEGFNEYNEFYNNNVKLIFLKERYIDTETYKKAMQEIALEEVQTGDTATNELLNSIMNAVNKFMLSKVKQDIYKAFEQAEKEVKDLRQRTKEGMQVSGAGLKISTTKTGTKYKVKKAPTTREFILKHYKKYNGTLNVLQCCELAKISRNTFFKYCRQIEQGENTV